MPGVAQPYVLSASRASARRLGDGPVLTDRHTQSHTRARVDEHTRTHTHTHTYTAYILLIYIVLPTMSSMAFSAFNLDRFDYGDHSVAFMTADYRIKWDSNARITAQGLAALIIAIFPLGQ